MWTLMRLYVIENLTDNELIVVRWPSIPSDKYKAKIV